MLAKIEKAIIMDNRTVTAGENTFNVVKIVEEKEDRTGTNEYEFDTKWFLGGHPIIRHPLCCHCIRDSHIFYLI